MIAGRILITAEVNLVLAGTILLFAGGILMNEVWENVVFLSRCDRDSR
jgi:hypothetical protein